ncbi:unnamed protein product, partial [Ectocarpus sp. 12 AP-2014]
LHNLSLALARSGLYLNVYDKFQGSCGVKQSRNFARPSRESRARIQVFRLLLSPRGSAGPWDVHVNMSTEVVMFAANRRGQLPHDLAADLQQEGQREIRSRRSANGRLVAQASRLQQGRRRSMQTFQSHMATEKNFTSVLHGIELEDPRPNTTQIDPQLQLPWPFLLRLKVNTFAVPLGLSSQAQLWGSLSRSSLLESALGRGIPDVVQRIYWVLALSLLAVIALGYFLKAMLYSGAVKREWAHPIRSNFVFAPLLASMTLTAAVPPEVVDALHPSTNVPLPAFMILSGLVLYLEMASYGKWLFNQTRSLSRANPSYQLAVVGNFLVASLGTQVSGTESVELACREISLFFFAVGCLYLLLVFFAIQHNSADNVEHPSSAAARLSADPTPDTSTDHRVDGRVGGNEEALLSHPTRRTKAGRVHGQQEQVPYPSPPRMPVSAAIVSGWGRKPSERVPPKKENRGGETGDRNGVGPPEGNSRYSGRLHDNVFNATVPPLSGLEDVPLVDGEDATVVAERGRANLEVDNEDTEDITARAENHLGARSSRPVPPFTGSGRSLLWRPSSSDNSSTMPSHPQGPGSGSGDDVNAARDRTVGKPAQEKPSTRPPTFRGESAGAAAAANGNAPQTAVFRLEGRGRCSSSNVDVGTPDGQLERAEAKDAVVSHRMPRSMLAPRGTPSGTPRSMLLSRALHPIYFLFIAPPSAAAIAWTRINGEFDLLSRSLYFIAGFLYMFFVLGNSSFLRTASFSVAWWAYSFPSATGSLFAPDPVLSVLLEELP